MTPQIQKIQIPEIQEIHQSWLACIFQFSFMASKYFYLLIFILSSCTLPEEKNVDKVLSSTDTSLLQTNDSNAALHDPELAQPLPLPQKIKSPSGIYQSTLPFDGGMVQTIEIGRASW